MRAQLNLEYLWKNRLVEQNPKVVEGCIYIYISVAPSEIDCSMLVISAALFDVCAVFLTGSDRIPILGMKTVKVG